MKRYNTPPAHPSADAVDALWQKLDLDPEALQEPRSYAGLRIMSVTLILAGLAILGYAFWVRPALLAAPMPALVQVAPVWTPAPAPEPTETATPVAAAVALPGVPLTGQAAEPVPPEPTALPGETILAPAARAVGWVSSLDGQGHFNDPNIHVGVLRGHAYYGALQFDLSTIPPNALITSASLELTGLSGQNLGPGGVWQVRLLDEIINPVWPALTHELLRDTEVDINVLPALTAEGLGEGKVNVFRFGPEQLAVLQQHLANGLVSFRLDGPTSGPDNFFTWDSGYRGQEVMPGRPALRIITEGRRYVVITSTPTPENALTALAMLNPMAQQHTPTPLPPHWVTPVVVTPPPQPANGGTATQEARLATAAAMAYGTPTPTPLNFWTATPTSLPLLVTATPTPENIVTAAAVAAVATHTAHTIGTYTPVPRNWITPVVVTPPPAPGNAATAEFDALMATAQVIVAGQGAAIWTATPTPISVGPTVFPTSTPTPGYEPVPEALVGKIAFLSDRAGDPDETGQEPLVYVMDPDGGNMALLTNRAPYDMALLRDSFSSDLRFRGYVEDFLRFDGQRVPGIYFRDELYAASEQITRFGSGIAYDPAWSPTSEQLAFISTETGNDDIWVVNRDGSGLLQLTNDPNWDKSPSWSPDGSQVIFWSNRTGNAQIWIMNRDGSDQRVLRLSAYNDWNPVWIKYPGLPPLLPTPTPTKPPVFTKYD